MASPKSAAGQASARLLEGVDEAIERLRLARNVAHEAQAREALTRAELTLALSEALIGRAEAEVAVRTQGLGRYVAERRPRSLRRRNRAARGLERLLARLASPGQALIIAWAGVWRGSGRPLHDLRHMAAYARRGAEPAVSPLTLFDQAWYLKTYPDVARAGVAPLTHYLIAGADEDRSPHPLLDGPWYRRQNAGALAAISVTPLEHYLRAGAAKARNPHPLFDIAHYALRADDLDPQEDPLSHYLRVGWGRGLSPHPLFDAAWYRRQQPRSAREIPALVHYLTEGWRAGMSPHPLFDPAWYLARNPDVAERGLEPLTHFVTAGAAEGRSPGPWFDLPQYVEARGEALAHDNPLIDYLQGGAWAVAEARPGFPTAAYLAATPELVRQGLTPLEHWARRQGPGRG